MSTLATSSEGLSSQQARAQLDKFGPNEIYQPHKISMLGIAREEVAEPMILLLILTGVIYSFLGALSDAITIFAVIVLLIYSEVLTEYRAKVAIDALQKLAAVKTRVKRDGQVLEIDTLEIVPDDVLILAPGTTINADAKVNKSRGLQVDESALTGEAYPVQKEPGDVVSAGTFVVAGEGEAVVTTTGKQTRLGQIAAKTKDIVIPRTALQLATKSLAGKLLYVALAFAILIPLLGILHGQDWKLMLLTGLALAFAVIPEELPIVITIVLGLGSYRLSRNRFLVKQLRTTETLGNVTVIVTDKTGTITEGHMQVAGVWPPNSNAALQSALQCVSEYALTPVDRVIEQRAKELGIAPPAQTLVRKRDLGGGKKTEAAIRQDGSVSTLYKSGAPEEVFASCESVPAEAPAELERQTAAGRRVIAAASKALQPVEAQLDFAQIEQGMTFSGLITLEDPARPGVKETIASAARAGVRTIMVTGDHPATAAYIARQVGIDAKKVYTGDELDQLSDEALQQIVRTATVFARTTPEHKYRIVKALQNDHEVVAVTGDGINDVLALKAADIGIAMGIKGTDVAKEAASAVLADDNFNTIATAIFEGRAFFDNLSKGMRYYLAIKLALILIFLLPVVLGLPLPFAPIQIIVLELFMDLAASAGFTAEPRERNIYTRGPRDPKENVFNNRAIADIVIKAVLLFAAVTGVYLYAYQRTSSLVEAQTLAFAAWILGHILLAYISRSDKELVVAIGPFTNRVINVWALAAIAFLLLGIYVPQLNQVFRLASIAVPELLIVFVVVLVILLVLEVKKVLTRSSGPSAAGSTS